LEKSLSNGENYFYGLPCYEGFKGILEYVMKNHYFKTDYRFVSYSTFFMGSNHFDWVHFMNDLIDSKYSNIHPVLLVNHRAIPRNSWFRSKFSYIYYIGDDGPNVFQNESERILDRIKSIARSHFNTLFLIAAGPLSKIFVHEMWMVSKCNQYIDIGSVLDPFTKSNNYPLKKDVSPWPEYTCSRVSKDNSSNTIKISEFDKIDGDFINFPAPNNTKLLKKFN
jgi:hypothetical protein